MKRLAHYSQYFLRNPGFVAQLVRAAGVTKQDHVLDIGAGSGIVTHALAERTKQVTAIEYEPRTVIKLRDNMAKHHNVTVVEADILEYKLPSDTYKVFANIPFHLSSQILRLLISASVPPVAIYLIVQKQFAKKIVQSNDHFTGALGMMVGPQYDARIVKRLKRTDFWPHPNVDTVLLGLEQREQPLLPPIEMVRYRKYVEDCYHDPKMFSRAPLGIINVPTTVKPSQLSLMQWAQLYLATLRQR
ncbi:methyltransferase domain-containing protein [Candidatus Saccharibacteria bacterium]|nr:methyltransferase domain-containing protein [Candidatus Saccharibacteria bacterium]